jgi:hypothetical protein
MTELQLYGNNGLFHNLVKQSRIMNGRYALLSKGAHDLNLNNLLSNLDLPQDFKYPGVFCLPPVSETEKINGFETFNFRLIFACTAEQTGDNQIKYKEPQTNTSLAKTAHDWQDMKNVAFSFLSALTKIQKSTNDFHLSDSITWRITRFANMQNDNLNGVLLFFSAAIFDKCEYDDIEVNDTVLTFPNHEIQFH